METIKILVFHEKHADSYYIYNTKEELVRIFLKELISRNKEGWFDGELKTLNLVKKAIDDKDGSLAYSIMSKRRDYEYENFEIVTPNRVE